MKKKKLTALLLAVTMTASLVLTGCGGNNGTGNEENAQPAAEENSDDQAESTDAGETSEESEVYTGKDTLVIAEAGDCGTLAPTGATVDCRSDINTQLYESLFRYGYNMEMVPKLATDWEWVDNTHCTFHLREGVKYHDGRDFTAADVLFTLKLNCEDANTSGVVTYLDYDNCVIEDDYTITLAFTEQNAFNLTKLSAMNIVNEEAYNESGDNMATHPVGTGPYKFESSVPGMSYTLTAFDDYWDGAPEYIKTVTFTVIAEGSQRTNALQSGEIDINKSLQSSDFAYLDGLDEYTAVSKAGTNTQCFFFNMTENSPFAAKELRQAVAYAVNNEEMNNTAYDGLSVPATGPWSPGMMDYDAGWTNPMYGQDKEKAKELVDSVGAPSDPITILYNGDPQNEIMAQILQANLAEIGIPAEISSVDAGVFWSAMGDPTGWDIGIMGCSAPSGYGLDSMTAFLTGLNFQGWSGPEYDKMAELCVTASVADSDEKRLEYTKELWDLIEEEVPLYGVVALSFMLSHDSALELDIYDQFTIYVKDIKFNN